MRRPIIFGLIAILSGCTSITGKVTDVSQETGYREMIGKEFKTLQPTALYKLGRREKEVQLEELGRGDVPRLEALEGKEFPYEAGPYAFILGVLPAGSTFRIEKAIYHQSFEISSVRYDAVISSSGPFQGTEVNPTWLAEVVTYPKVPQFEPGLVQEVTAGKR